ADQLMPGKRLSIASSFKSAGMAARALPDAPFDLPAAPPTVTGATLRIVDTGGGSPTMQVTLQASKWKGLGNPPGALGWAYSGAGDASDPCKGAVVMHKSVRFRCAG